MQFVIEAFHAVTKYILDPKISGDKGSDRNTGVKVTPGSKIKERL